MKTRVHHNSLPLFNCIPLTPPPSILLFVFSSPHCTWSKGPICVQCRRPVWSYLRATSPLLPTDLPERGGCLRLGMWGLVNQISTECTSPNLSGGGGVVRVSLTFVKCSGNVPDLLNDWQCCGEVGLHLALAVEMENKVPFNKYAQKESCLFLL